ncbi:cob(I)yrinic acid a,c-diamide adenosyltransferase [Bacillus inaquosorum]|uniref:cob(I)yrinic acid a,c-diamide adenosyltransferase n=1 Tax=Bacillus inaquosorum TaxID=483913 RepID=UPI002281690E|nr:cob(I)yrinic acid a,c-diamide adenosyltransferase [Bacillus inaquosorum]MCY7751186.1 cob(I)yrinic acid a,c-diamide adenosyltransferase [Bacillus inaquosorum]MCY7963693.1 cob(I)yrinic acid a,c-diamide adenosyltransferase [Bacillus inaquosorum]MCY8144831.1 cob(I)yrinic acid a,c-diamide adenosyltransferase [Bacillus inaquosorum]MCY8182239.1 cob(I)yrinic acid a,c-diamide adenosyltransferase [Bacillus inaquosorum]MCY8797093.1 cob(I)yrinic acid a,c-diamide adenosyltransferase [Bacillus inaquosoru
MKLYTKTGDKGQTSLVGGRTDKDSLRVESYGTIDELNSFVGLALSELSGQPGFEDLTAELLIIQHELFDCGGDLAIVTERKDYKLKEESVSFLETRIDAYTSEAPELKKFILPGGSKSASLLHAARTIARRAERRVVTLMKSEEIHETVLRYLNRLSDYFFAAARVVNVRSGIDDVEYERSAIVFRDRNSSES